jgi:hypothetical protein
MSRITENLKYTRKIYNFPVPGDLYNPFGQPRLIKTETFKSIGDSNSANSAKSNDYLIVDYCTAHSSSIGITAIPSVRYLYGKSFAITAKVDSGPDRTYYGFQKGWGRVTPADLNTINQIIQGGLDLAESTGKGVITALKYIASLISLNAGVGNLDYQPLPTHKTGIIRIEASLKGTAKEGGAMDGNYTTFADVDCNFVTDVFTKSFNEFLVARQMWNEFQKVDSSRRQFLIRKLQGYLKQRDEWIKRQRTGGLIGNMGQNFPNPYNEPGEQAFDWVMWAWSRNLDPTQPPPDTRRTSYPGYNYGEKREWFRY